MAVVNATSQFAVANNKLALSYSAMSRMVLYTQANSTGDGQITDQNDRRTLIDLRAHWKSPYTVPVRCVAHLQRRRFTLQCGGGNFIYLRESFKTAIGIDSTSQILAPEPTVDTDWNTEFGGGIGSASAGPYRTSTAETSCIINGGLDIVNPGQSIDVRHRTGLFVQTPWAGNTDNFVYAFTNFIRLFVYPENGS